MVQRLLWVSLYVFFCVLQTPSLAQSGNAYFSDAFKFSQQGQDQKAIELYKEGLRRDPDNGLGHYYLAKLYEKSYNRNDAYVHFRRASELIPDTEQGRDALATRRILASEIFDYRRKALEKIDSNIFKYHLEFDSKTHRFCAIVYRKYLEHYKEDIVFTSKSFIELKMWIQNLKSRNMEEVTQRYSLRWSKWAGETSLKIDATGELSKLGKYIPSAEIVDYYYKGKHNFSIMSENLKESNDSGELSYASTEYGSASKCWRP